MASGIKTMQIDMNSLMNDVNNVIQTHIHKAVLNFNVFLKVLVINGLVFNIQHIKLMFPFWKKRLYLIAKR